MMITSVSHDPFLVPQWFGQPVEGMYDKYIQTIRYNDAFLEELCRRLDSEGLRDNTILCVLGDHGTSFVDRTSEIETRWTVNEDVVRIPWVLRWPGRVRPGHVVKSPCSQVDVAPTVLSLMGFGVGESGFDGHDVLSRDDDMTRRLFFASLPADGPGGFTQGREKIVYWPHIGRVYRHDIYDDTTEESPEALEGEQAEQMKKAINDWRQHTAIAIDPKRQTQQVLFSHWRTFTSGESAWAYYVP
jgi:arylsulfatase A-like enzyme